MDIFSVEFLGTLLIITGLVLITAEIIVPGYCACAATGAAAILFGVVALMDSTLPGYGIASSILLGTAISLLLLGGLAAWFAFRAHRNPVVSGAEEMTGLVAEALCDFAGEGPVEVHGERWTARVASPVARGQKLRIVSLNGLCLDAEPA